MDFVIGFGMIKNVNETGLQLLHGSSRRSNGEGTLRG